MNMTANAVQVFSYEGNPVRSLIRDDEPWFVGKDVCAALDIKNHTDSLSRLDADEKGVAITDPLSKTDRGGGAQEVTIVSEPGVYRLVFTSRTEAAERFKRWLAHEVLPALRRTGAFALAAGDDEDMPKLSHGMLWGQPVAKVNAAARLIGVVSRIYGPEAARALWEREKGLPNLSKLSVAAMSGAADGDAVGCFKHLLRAAIGAQRTIAAHLDLAWHDRLAADALEPFGVAIVDRPQGQFLAVAEKNRFLKSLYGNTQWGDSWRLALAKLPDTRPAKTARKFGNEESRFLLIPRSTVNKIRFPGH